MVRCSIVVAAEIGSDITGVEIEVGSNNIVLSDVVGIAKLIDEVWDVAECSMLGDIAGTGIDRDDGVML